MIERITKSIDEEILQNAFDLQFRSNIFFIKFENSLLDCVEKWAPQNSAPSEIFAPMFFLCQSSGHGKSRCMKEFSKMHPSLYISLGEHINTYPKISNISDLLLKSLETFNSTQSFLFNLIDKSLDLIGRIKKPSVSFIEEFNSYQNNFVDQAASSKLKNQAFFKLIDANNVEGIDEFEMNKRLMQKFKLNSFNEPFFIFLDEANSLLENSKEIDQQNQKYYPKYKILRKSLQILLIGVQIVFAG